MTFKVLHVSHSLETGGGPLYIKKVVQDVPEVRHYVAGNAGYFYDLFQQTLGKGRVAKLSGKNVIANFFIIRRFCKKEGIFIIHCHGRGASLYSRLVKLFSPDIKIIYTVHGFFPETVSPVVRHLYILLEKVLFYYTNYVIHVSLSEKERFLKYIKPSRPSCCLYIPNYITASDVTDRALPVTLNHSTVNLIYIGRLGHEKGIDILIDAMPLLRKYPVKLWIIGYGPLEESIKDSIARSAIQEQISLLGKYDGASSFLRYFDAIVIPSRFEGMPFIGLESMIQQMPIICTPAVGITDLVTEHTAYMARDFQARSLSEAIVRFLTDHAGNREYVQEKVQANYKRVLTEFSAANADKLKVLYRELTNNL